MSLQCILVATYRAAVIRWAFRFSSLCLLVPTLQAAAVLCVNSLMSLQCILVAIYHAAVILWALGIFISVSFDTDLPSSSGPVDIRYYHHSAFGIPPTETHQSLSGAELHTGSSFATYSLRLVLRSVDRLF
jgi:hypothetical protein